MKNSKNELLQFVGGAAMLAVGLFIFSQKVIVRSSWFGFGGFSIGGFRISSGLVIVPLIIGIVWMFATNSFASKVFSAFAVLLILASIIMGTDIRLTSMTLYEWIIILVLIFGGAGFVAKVLFASNGSQKGGRKNKSEEDFKGQAKSIDDQLEEIKKNMK
jgi:hypothetical protein